MFPDLKRAIYEHEKLAPEPVKGPPISKEEMAQVVEPVRMFDDLYMAGCKSNAIYILKTSEGLVLFDATEQTDAYERYLLPGLKAFGLDQEPVNVLFLTHGHHDHYRGADGIRRATGCQVGLSEADCAYMVWSYENALPDGEFKGEHVPRITFLVHDNETFRFGDHTVTTMIGRGHTPGCLNFVFEVHEGKETHKVLLHGGFIAFGPDAYMDFNGVYPYGIQWSVDEALHYASSSVRMWEYAKEHNCDVYLNPHTFACDFFEHAKANAGRKPGEKNAFVIGKDGVRRFLASRFRNAIDSACRFTDIEKEYCD